MNKRIEGAVWDTVVVLVGALGVCRVAVRYVRERAWTSTKRL
jgi:hypothetical protein